MPSPKNLTEFTSEIVKSFAEYDKLGCNHWGYLEAIRDLPNQVGALTRLTGQLTGDRYNHGQSPDEIKTKMADELADIMAEVLFAAHYLEIDMNKALEDMLLSDREKITTRAKIDVSHS